MATMTKKDLIKKLALETNEQAATCERIVDSLILTISEELKNEAEFQLLTIGKFMVKDRAERQGRNPRTGEVITIKASKAVTFKVSKHLKDFVNL